MTNHPLLRRLAGPAALVLSLGLGACARDEATSDGGSARQPADGVAIQDYDFKPDPIKIKVGTEVTWTNKDGFDHSVKADDNSFESPDMAKDVPFTHRFDEAGTFTYFCGIHNYMKGSVVVE